jgi:hypothetical protein
VTKIKTLQTQLQKAQKEVLQIPTSSQLAPPTNTTHLQSTMLWGGATSSDTLL